jgi:hypothetical protein
MTFPNIEIFKLHDLCWNIDNIAKALSKEKVKIRYTEKNNSQVVSYECKYMFFRHDSTYSRKRTDEKSSIYFEALTNSHNIPFIPNTIKDIGKYSFSMENNIPTIHYTQYVVCDDEISELYMNDINKRVTKYFNTFVMVGEKIYYD